MRIALACCAAVVAACGSQAPMKPPGGEPQPASFTFHCQKNWADCYSQVRKQCGDRGFEEVDRHAGQAFAVESRMTGASHGREPAVVQQMDRTITVRCK